VAYATHIVPLDETATFPLEDWLSYIRSDAEMRLDGALTLEVQGQGHAFDMPALAVWTAYSKHGIGGNTAWFIWTPEQITVKNADAEIRRKMYRIAQIVQARL
jgi:hypothetical protein